MSTTPDLLAAFAPLIGRWRTTGTALDPTGRTTLTIHGTDEYEWLPGQEWLIHRAELLAGDAPTSTIELIGDYDTVRDCLTARSFDATGGLETMTVVRLPDGAWRLIGDEARGILRPAPDRSAIAAQWERCRDDGTWIPWMDLHHTPADA